ncbi:MAG: hypothetical protein AAFR61_29220 [Bacteroidota bacterium]
MSSIEQQKKDAYKTRIDKALDLIREKAWDTQKRFSARALLAELQERGIDEISLPTFNRLQRGEKSVSLNMYWRILQALEAYLNQNLSLVYDQDTESYVQSEEGHSDNEKQRSRQTENQFSKFPTKEIRHSIKNAKEEIIFLQSYMSFLPELRDVLEKAVRGDVKVRALVYMPGTTAQAQRNEELGEEKAGELKAKSITTLEELYKIINLRNESKGELRVLSHRGTSINFIKIDQTIFQGYYLENQTLMDSPFEIREASSTIGHALEQHFNKLWVEEGLPYAELKEQQKEDQHEAIKNTSMLPSAQAGETYFRAFYIHRLGERREFLLKVPHLSPDSEPPHVHQAEIIHTLSGTHYTGELTYFEGEAPKDVGYPNQSQRSRVVSGFFKGHTDSPLKRFAHISINLKDHDRSLVDRYLLQGVIQTTDPYQNTLICSRLLLFRMDRNANQVEKYKAEGEKDKGKIMGLPIRALEEFFKPLFSKLKDNYDTYNGFLKAYEGDLDASLVIKDLTGYFDFFTISPDKEGKLLRRRVEVLGNGVLMLIRRPDYRTYLGKITKVGRDFVIMEMRFEDRNGNYWIILKLSPKTEEVILKGIFTGTHENELTETLFNGGRVMGIKLTENEAEEPLTDEFESYVWHDPKTKKKFKKRWKKMVHFFAGLDNHFIENSRALNNSSNWVNYHPSDDMDSLAGTYDWYYKSSAERQMGGIRKLAIEIKDDCEVTMLEKTGGLLKGHAMRNGSQLIIRQFKYPNFSDYKNREEYQDYGPRVQFQSLMLLYMDDTKDPKILTGIISEHSRRGEPLSRKVVLVRNDAIDIKTEKPTRIPITTESALQESSSYSERTMQALEYLRTIPFHFIKTDVKPLVELEKDHQQEEFVHVFLHAALEVARKGKDRMALQYVEQSIRYGLRKDDEALVESLQDDQPLAHLSPQIASLLDQ